AVVLRFVCNAGNATFTTGPSINAMLEARMVAARTQRPRAFVHGSTVGPHLITFSSQASCRITGNYLQHPRSAQYFHVIPTDADIGNAFPFPHCPDMHFTWAPALDALSNHYLLIIFRHSVLDHPTRGATSRRPCGRVLPTVEEHSSSSFEPAFASFGTEKVEKVRTGFLQKIRCLNVTKLQIR